MTGFKLFDNHRSIDLVEDLFARGTPAFGRTLHRLRRLIFAEAAGSGVDLIFTYVYAHLQDDAEMQWMLETFEKHGAATQLVQLTCEPEKLTERVVATSRQSKGKIVDAGFLNDLLKTHDLFTPYPARPNLQLDTTHTPPAETAAAIAAHLKRKL